MSEATVSRVLHDKPGIAAATRDSVLTALDVMGYQRPFRHRSEMARLVGMVLPDLHNPIFPAYAEAMAARAVSAGPGAGAVHPHVRRRLRGALHRDAAGQQVAGIVFVAASYADAGPEQAAALQRASCRSS